MSKITTYTQISDHTKYSSQQKTILELEKKYYIKLLSIFSKQEFLDELRALMNDINKRWVRIHRIWGKANVVDLAVERHINYRIYNDSSFKGIINSVYPSVISSDTAFVTDDAVINIDSKTVNVKSNFTDWKRQLVGCNQHSFDNKKNFFAPNKKIYMPIDGFLAKQNHHGKPVLSFFLNTLYSNDLDNEIDSWYEDSNFKKKPYISKKSNDRERVNEVFTKNIQFACMPNGHLSNLFKNNIFAGVKSYYPANDPNPTNTKSMRVDHRILSDRYDSSGKPWKGFTAWKI